MGAIADFLNENLIELQKDNTNRTQYIADLSNEITMHQNKIAKNNIAINKIQNALLNGGLS